MSQQMVVSAADRLEMMRAHRGVVTAIIADDEAAMSNQIVSMLRDQIDSSGGDMSIALGRIGKQLEAAARLHVADLRLLATRTGHSLADLHRALAEATSDARIADEMP